MSKGTPGGKKRPKSGHEVDIDLDSSLEDDEDISEMTSDELIRKFLPILPRVNKKLSKMSSAIKAQNLAIEALNEKVDNLEQTVAEVTQENEILYRNLNKNNLIISGVNEESTETGDSLIEFINELASEKLGKKINMYNAYRMGVKTANQPRPVKFTVLDPRDRDYLWANKKQLGHPHYVSEDLHKNERKRNGRIIKFVKEKREEGKTVLYNFRKRQVKADEIVYLLKDENFEAVKPKLL